VPPIGIGQAVTFFEKELKKAAISPNPLWQALGSIMDLEFKQNGVDIVVLEEALSPSGEVTEIVRSYISELISNLQQYREFVASKMLKLYNETWYDESIGSLSKQDFVAKLINPSIDIYDQEGYAVIYFDDSNVFGGHYIEVGVKNGAAEDAGLAG